MKYTIKDLAEGKCVAINEGRLNELQKVIELAFPNDDAGVLGENRYYFADPARKQLWRCSKILRSDIKHLPTQAVIDFLKFEPEYVWGEEIQYGNNSIWTNGYIYIGRDCKITNLHIIQDKKTGEVIKDYDLRIRRAPKVIELTMQQIADKFEIDVSVLRIKKE